MNNEMELKFKAILSNELLARQSVISFISQLNPSFDEIGEIKTIISEGVSNAIIHGYKFDEARDVYLKCSLANNVVTIQIKDYGVGIENIDEAKKPHFTSRPDLERAGMGMTIIDTLSDEFDIKSVLGMGTRLIIKKYIVGSCLKDETTI